MHKEGLESYNDLIKIFILPPCTSIRQYREVKIAICGLYIYMYITIQ